MENSQIASALAGLVSRFRRAEQGNIAVIFAIALIPMIGFVGGAVDFSQVSDSRSKMQAALDSAALMVAKDVAANGLTAAQISAEAQSIFNALFNRADVTDVSISATYTTTPKASLVLTGSGTRATPFMKLVGTPTITFNLSSTIAWGQSRLRVALVLDNTGSMAQDGKIGALKTATNNLLTKLKSAATNDGDVYVSIIPFVKDVNLGPSNYNATWIDWSDWDATNGSCSKSSLSDQATCTSKGKIWTADNHNSWNGCVVDRGNSNAPDPGNYDTNVVAPALGITATLYAAEQYGSCPQAVMGLNYNWAAMTSLVTAMAPNGTTNQAIGLQAGWMSLVGGGPFVAPAMASNYSYQQYIILLTDGLNTEDRWYSSESSIDARQQKTCANIKAAGITLFTIQVNTGGDPTSTLLKNCASTASNFFLLTSAAAMVSTFDSIGTQITKLHIAK